MEPEGKVVARVFRCQWALCLLLILAPPRIGAASPTEYELKLVYLFNFTKYVSWPDSAFESAESPLHICTIGKVQESGLATQLSNKQARNRPIAFTQLTSFPQQTKCHILFVSRSVGRSQLHSIVSNLDTPTLLVGETPDFAKHHGVIGFVLDGQRRIRLEINLIHAQQRQLSIRAQLLEIARTVYRDEERS